MFPLLAAVKKSRSSECCQEDFGKSAQSNFIADLKHILMVYLATHLIPFSKSEPISLLKWRSSAFYFQTAISFYLLVDYHDFFHTQSFRCSASIIFVVFLN